MSIDGAKYVRLFNRLEKAVGDYFEEIQYVVEDDADEKLHAAYRAVVKASQLPPAEPQSPTTPPCDGANVEGAGISYRLDEDFCAAPVCACPEGHLCYLGKPSRVR